MLIGLKVEHKDSDDVLEVYSSDASRWYKKKPIAVLFPKNIQEVQESVRFCWKNGIPITPRGGGSGLVGGAVPEERGVVVSLEKMSDFSIEDNICHAQSGAISGQIEKEANRLKMTLPAHPSSLNFSTIGGNVACDSAGLRSVKYGSMRDYLESVTAVVKDGEIINLSGSLASLFAGSQGMLGIISNLKIRLVRLKKRVTGTFLFQDYKSALNFAYDVLKIQPSALEFVDDYGTYIMDLPMLSPGLCSIIVEIEEDLPNYQYETLELIKKVSAEFGGVFVDAPDIWEKRKKLGPALSKIKIFKINEDIVLPLSKIPDFLQFIKSKDEVRTVVFGHIGVGILHTNFMFGVGEKNRVDEIRKELFSYVISAGGAITGEHGTGISKKDFIESEIGKETLSFMLSLKSIFDPGGIFNPGKIPVVTRGCIDTSF